MKTEEVLSALIDACQQSKSQFVMIRDGLQSPDTIKDIGKIIAVLDGALQKAGTIQPQDAREMANDVLAQHAKGFSL